MRNLAHFAGRVQQAWANDNYSLHMSKLALTSGHNRLQTQVGGSLVKHIRRDHISLVHKSTH